MAEVTDFHTHAFPDKIADRTIAALAATCGQTPTHNGGRKACGMPLLRAA